jgi:phosphohistidine phosphatase SixA
MRHADSEDPKQLPGVRDHDRPITAGGKDAAKDVSFLSFLLTNACNSILGTDN